MTFDPGYCPQSVKFVISGFIAEEDIADFSELYQTYYSKLGQEIGLDISLDLMTEEGLQELVQNVDPQKFTKDMLYLIHGNSTGDILGVDLVKQLEGVTDARYIVTYDPTIDLFLANRELPSSPEHQVSYVTNMVQLSLTRAEEEIKEYFEALAALRGKE